MIKPKILKLTPKTKPYFFGKKILNKNILLLGFNDYNSDDLVEKFPVFLKAKRVYLFCNTGDILEKNIFNSKNVLKYFPKDPNVCAFQFRSSPEKGLYITFKVNHVENVIFTIFDSDCSQSKIENTNYISDIFDEQFIEEEIVVKE